MPRRRRPLQEGEVASGILQQRTFVDHGELEVGVGIVHGLAPGLGYDHQREAQGGHPVRRCRPDAGAGGGVTEGTQIGAAQRQSGQHQDE